MLQRKYRKRKNSRCDVAGGRGKANPITQPKQEISGNVITVFNPGIDPTQASALLSKNILSGERAGPGSRPKRTEQNEKSARGDRKRRLSVPVGGPAVRGARVDSECD
ncbi:hypothetical protein GWI33_004892 [Rhynchophorus ferrugineus]|uniref:Uncharacterized protein n=1 Tax=Rhynchophorus ferrugineus TaxID=354439 RepID=A0A834MIE1_RHYFE|nr:hypothetical protein GWI33_004892 [Rhynchophorus ferrugineus]